MELFSGLNMADAPVALTPREAASGVLGSVSMTCWIFLLVRSRLPHTPRDRALDPGEY